MPNKFYELKCSNFLIVCSMYLNWVTFDVATHISFHFSFNNRTYIRVKVLTLSGIYLPWYVNIPFIHFCFIRYLCLQFSKVLVKRCSFAQNSTKFDLDKPVKLTNSSPFNFLHVKLINYLFYPNVCSVVSTLGTVTLSTYLFNLKHTVLV